MREPEIVELHQAFMWDCPECGRENFERAITAELTDQERIDLLRQMGEFIDELDENVHGEFVAAPCSVTCRFCDHQFRTNAHPDFD